MISIRTHCPQCGAKIESTAGSCYSCGWFPGQALTLPETKVHVCPKCDGETVVPGPFMPVSNGTQRVCPCCGGRGFVVVRL